MRKTCIFLDFDGVLNNSRTKAVMPLGYVGISDRLTKRLSRIVEETGADVVLTTSWKEYWDTENEVKAYVCKKFNRFRIYIKGRIEHEPANCRGYLVKQYLKEHHYDGYVLLDDETFDYYRQNMTDHLVLTNDRDGLTDKDVEKAIEILKK